jgi:cell pole-organizing protein PopZ
LAQTKQTAAESQAQKDTLKDVKDRVAAKAAADKKAAAARANAARAAAAKQAEAAKEAAAAKEAEAASPPAPQDGPVPRDANGFALGGPPEPKGPANYNAPSQSDCLRFRDELRAWSNYQNQHRPAGSTNDLPSSGEVQYLYVVCHLNY